jgi:hypothetical protein
MLMVLMPLPTGGKYFPRASLCAGDMVRRAVLASTDPFDLMVMKIFVGKTHSSFGRLFIAIENLAMEFPVQNMIKQYASWNASEGWHSVWLSGQQKPLSFVAATPDLAPPTTRL